MLAFILLLAVFLSLCAGPAITEYSRSRGSIKMESHFLIIEEARNLEMKTCDIGLLVVSRKDRSHQGKYDGPCVPMYQ